MRLPERSCCSRKQRQRTLPVLTPYVEGIVLRTLVGNEFSGRLDHDRLVVRFEVDQQGPFSHTSEWPDPLHGRGEQGHRLIQPLGILEHTDGGLWPGIAGAGEGFFNLTQSGDVFTELVSHLLRVLGRLVGFEQPSQPDA